MACSKFCCVIFAPFKKKKKETPQNPPKQKTQQFRSLTDCNVFSNKILIHNKLKNQSLRYLKLCNQQYDNSALQVFDQIALRDENSSPLITLLKMSHGRYGKQHISVDCLNNQLKCSISSKTKENYSYSVFRFVREFYFKKYKYEQYNGICGLPYTSSTFYKLLESSNTYCTAMSFLNLIFCSRSS